MRRGLGEGGRLRWKVLSVILLTAFSGVLGVFAAEKRGPTIVIKKDEHRIAGVGDEWNHPMDIQRGPR